jgi:3-oxoacyl-[acyl-carrier-protein] synthase-1
MFLVGTGMVTALGLTASASCAAMRSRIAAFTEVPYLDVRGEPIIGAPVLAVKSRRKGRERLLDLAVPALRECLEASAAQPDGSAALLLGLGQGAGAAEAAADPAGFLGELEVRSKSRFSADSRLVIGGSSSVASGIKLARSLLRENRASCCIVGAVDSLLDAPTLRQLELSRRLKKETNPDGIIPGEAACFTAWMVRPAMRGPHLQVSGAGVCSGPRTAGANDLPGSALTSAMEEAFAEAETRDGDVSWEITDLTGEHELFIEHAVAMARVFTDPQPRVHCWHQAMSLGTVGAAAGVCSVAWADAAVAKGYAPGSYVLCTASAETAWKSSVLLNAAGNGIDRG